MTDFSRSITIRMKPSVATRIDATDPNGTTPSTGIFQKKNKGDNEATNTQIDYIIRFPSGNSSTWKLESKQCGAFKKFGETAQEILKKHIAVAKKYNETSLDSYKAWKRAHDLLDGYVECGKTGNGKKVVVGKGEKPKKPSRGDVKIPETSEIKFIKKATPPPAVAAPDASAPEAHSDNDLAVPTATTTTTSVPKTGPIAELLQNIDQILKQIQTNLEDSTKKSDSTYVSRVTKIRADIEEQKNTINAAIQGNDSVAFIESMRGVQKSTQEFYLATHDHDVRQEAIASVVRDGAKISLFKELATGVEGSYEKEGEQTFYNDTFYLQLEKGENGKPDVLKLTLDPEVFEFYGADPQGVASMEGTWEFTLTPDGKIEKIESAYQNGTDLKGKKIDTGDSETIALKKEGDGWVALGDTTKLNLDSDQFNFAQAGKTEPQFKPTKNTIYDKLLEILGQIRTKGTVGSYLKKVLIPNLKAKKSETKQTATYGDIQPSVSIPYEGTDGRSIGAIEMGVAGVGTVALFATLRSLGGRSRAKNDVLENLSKGTTRKIGFLERLLLGTHKQIPKLEKKYPKPEKVEATPAESSNGTKNAGDAAPAEGVTKLKAELDAVVIERDGLLTKLEKSKEAKGAAEQKVTEKMAEAARLERELLEAQESASQPKADSTISLELDSAKSQIESLETELGQAQRDLETANSNLDAATPILSKLQHLEITLQTKVRELEGQLRSVSDELCAERDGHIMTAERAQSLGTENASLRSQLSEAPTPETTPPPLPARSDSNLHSSLRVMPSKLEQIDMALTKDEINPMTRTALKFRKSQLEGASGDFSNLMYQAPEQVAQIQNLVSRQLGAERARQTTGTNNIVIEALEAFLAHLNS